MPFLKPAIRAEAWSRITGAVWLPGPGKQREFERGLHKKMIMIRELLTPKKHSPCAIFHLPVF
jgi:hypothetical protein